VSDGVCARTEVVMGTLVTIQVLRRDADAAVDRAFGWFRHIEERCTRFNPESELMQLTTRIGMPVPVSAVVYEAVRFALQVAEQTDGAFDPTVGHRMESRGFNREYGTDHIVSTGIAVETNVTYRDVVLDATRKTITLRRPLVLDLGAVAKGLAIDTAVRELQGFTDFTIDAGGDLYMGGCRTDGEPWSVGIRHPRPDHRVSEPQLIEMLRVSNKAVCTSGDYERGEHILDVRAPETPHTVASATVVAPSALLADALATAAFVLGPTEGLALLERHGVEGLIVTPALERHHTRGLYDA
jgi:thiamine biosynthesis lipoprotein